MQTPGTATSENVKSTALHRRIAALAWIVAWTWAVAAGGGGVWLLWTKGPWPLTNGWFALASGVAACPLAASLLKRYAGIAVSPRVQLGVAALFFIAGKLALQV